MEFLFLSREKQGLFQNPFLLLGGLCLCAGLLPVSPLPAGMVALACLVLLRPARRVWFVALALCALCALRAHWCIEAFEAERIFAREELGAPQRCVAQLRVMSSPVVRGSTGEERVTVWTGEGEHFECEHSVIQRRLQVRLYGGPEDLARGDQVEVIAQLAPVQLFRNHGAPDPGPGAARRGFVWSGAALSVHRETPGRGLTAWIDGARFRVRGRIEATFAPQVVELARALVLGENDLAEEDAEAFARSGLLHVLAVSGTHLVLAILSLVRAARAILVRIEPWARRWDVARLSAAAGACGSLFYADFAGGSGSAWRAAWMLCALLGARALGLRLGGASACGISLLVGSLFDPLVGFDLSFLLSALATLGLIGWGQAWTQALSRFVPSRYGLPFLLASCVATVSSTLPCAPVLALMDGQVTAAALLANLVAGPLGELIALPACLLHAVSAPWPSLERGLAWVGSGALLGVRWTALWSASVESTQAVLPLPSGAQIAFLVLACLSGELLRTVFPSAQLRRVLVALLLSAAVLDSGLRGQPREGKLSVTALDVGQGDAFAVRFPDQSFALVDGGGVLPESFDMGKRVLVPYLRAQRQKQIDWMIVSHGHPDHILGLVSVARRFPVRELWHPGRPSAQRGAYKELIDLVRAAGGRILSARDLCGRPWERAGVQIEVLSPCAAPEDWGENDASLVLRWTYGEHRLLWTGDIEGPAEKYLVEQDPERLAADFLKVAHHGSLSSSSPEFLDRVRPRWAVISSGVRNRYRHPRPEVLDRLQARQVEILRTDRLGSLLWRSDSRQAEIFLFDAREWSPAGGTP